MSLPLKTLLTILAGIALRITAALGADPPTEPMLRREMEQHVASITSLDMDRAECFLVTGSEDKTVPVWSLADGKLLQVLRPLIGLGYEGQVHAVAISPDGSTVAEGGMTGPGPFTVYLFDRQTGKLLRAFSGHPHSIFKLAFSPDGRF